MLFTALTQRITRKRPTTIPRKSEYPPVVVNAGGNQFIASETVFSAKLYRKGRTVLLLNSKDRVLSLRPEYCDPNYVEHQEIVNYRANVYDMVTGRVRFVDLTPGQMLRVI